MDRFDSKNGRGHETRHVGMITQLLGIIQRQSHDKIRCCCRCEEDTNKKKKPPSRLAGRFKSN